MRRAIWLALVCGVALTGHEAKALRLNDFSWFSSSGVGRLYARTDSKTWVAAEADAVKVGAHLVTIDNVNENNFLRGAPYYGNAWIGINDQTTEGTWVWAAGDGGYWQSGDPGSTSYVNWNAGEPNNAGAGEDYAQIRGDGLWNDLGSTATSRGIVEFPKTIASPGSAVWTYQAGTGKAYGLTPSLPWEMAQGVAQMWGGNLATVPNAATNAFLQSKFATASSRWIGLNDRDVEGTFVWSSGATDAYRNWQSPPEPNGGTAENYAELRTDGFWNDVGQATERQGIAERAVGHEGWRYNKATGHFYARLNTPLTWQDAEARAVDMGGHLASLGSAVENDWVVRSVGTGWIGYQDVWQSGDPGSDPPGRWVWADGDTSTFLSWNNSNPLYGGRGTGGEPNGASEDHAEMNLYYIGATGETRGIWNDLSGSNARNGLVERTTKPDDFPAAPSSWTLGPDGLMYAVSPVPMTWEQANSVADYYGFQLATIHSAEMNEWLRSQFTSVGSLWIGLTDRDAAQAEEPAAGWEWIDGTPLDFTRWNAGEPNGNRGENYAALFNSGYWNDYGGSSTLYALYSIPEPGSVLLLASGALLVLVARRSVTSRSRRVREA